LEELEAVRLTDLEGLSQEDAAHSMGISRRALWEDLQNARSKIVDALVSGKAIEIKGGNYALEGGWRYTCHECESEWDEPGDDNQPPHCPSCGSEEVGRRCGGQEVGTKGSAHRGRCHNAEMERKRRADHDER
jgi:hypothetical protein